jgi:hypothetical protein
LFLFTCLGYYIFSKFTCFCNIVQLLLLSVTMTNALSVPFYMHTMYIYIYLYKCCLCNYDCFHNFGLMECGTKVKVTHYLCCRFQFWYKWQFFCLVLHCCIASVWIRKIYLSSRQSVLIYLSIIRVITLDLVGHISSSRMWNRVMSKKNQYLVTSQQKH